MVMEKGLLIILSGPSGVGKGTVRKQIIHDKKIDFVYSVSMTTRPKREKETDGVDYYFVSKKEFQKNIDNNNFLEWCEFVGNRYGTPKDKVEALRAEGKNVFLEIEISGAEQILHNVKDGGVLSFYLIPPSLKELERRIRKRKSEPEEVIQARLEKGKREMAFAGNYDHIIVNKSIKHSANEIARIVKKTLQKKI